MRKVSESTPASGWCISVAEFMLGVPKDLGVSITCYWFSLHLTSSFLLLLFKTLCQVMLRHQWGSNKWFFTEATAINSATHSFFPNAPRHCNGVESKSFICQDSVFVSCKLELTQSPLNYKQDKRGKGHSCPGEALLPCVPAEEDICCLQSHTFGAAELDLENLHLSSLRKVSESQPQ